MTGQVGGTKSKQSEMVIQGGSDGLSDMVIRWCGPSHHHRLTVEPQQVPCKEPWPQNDKHCGREGRLQDGKHWRRHLRQASITAYDPSQYRLWSQGGGPQTLMTKAALSLPHIPAAIERSLSSPLRCSMLLPPPPPWGFLARIRPFFMAAGLLGEGGGGEGRI